ncbi:hypothetical protein [Psychrobacillus sp. L3]|uniref:hypothetical protein n=1 Tax=Psychrobacillus sp. L3 TaxID=3236891 RepID=UPI0036F39446
MNEIKIPFGLCEITYDDMKLPAMADEGVFSAIPTYTKMFGGALNDVNGYILESYEVTFKVSVNDESYETLKLMQTLETHEDGLYDDPSNFDIEGKRLIIHPFDAVDKEFDICIWNAYISPETGFKRTYKKETDEFEIVFIGTRVKNKSNPHMNNTYFFIGDWEKVGGYNA